VVKALLKRPRDVFFAMTCRVGQQSCQVCCDKFTSKLRPPVTCPGCDYVACVKCLKSYLLSTLRDPSCMNCGLYFNRRFLDTTFTANWRNGPLRQHRQAVLLDREKALLPATQPAVERRALWLQLDEARKLALLQLRQARQSVYDASRHYNEILSRRHDLQREELDQAPSERRTFVAACPREQCKGFLSNHYKCGTCLKSFCAACREEKAQGGEAHQCDPDTVATIKAILSDSKPCPGCGMSINRVSGCDQMYCTLCDVAFSYRTGLRIQGVIHNPHYFERLRQLRAAEEANAEDPSGAAAMLRANAEEQACGAWPSFSFLNNKRLSDSCRRLVSSFYRTATNIQHVYLVRMARFRRARGDNEDLRVGFCLQELSEEKFKQRLEQRERRRDLELDAREVLETFVLLCMELAYRMRRQVEVEGASCDEQEATLRLHCEAVEDLVNAPLRDVSARFKVPTASIRVPEISPAHRSDEDLLHAPEWLRRARGLL